MKLSIVIPAYNEEKRLPPSLKKIFSWLKKQPGNNEIIVVDDGSSDNMLFELEKLKKRIKNLKIISYKPNKGKGYAVKKGMLVAKGEIVVFTDADLSTPIREVEKVVKEITSGVEVVIGSRFIEGAKKSGSVSILRKIASNIFLWGVRALLFYGPKDTQCGFKGFTKKSARKIFRNIKSNSVLFDLEIFLLASRYGFKIKEIPVVWKHDPDSRLTYNFKKSLLAWLGLFRLKFIYKIVLPINVRT